MGGNFQPVTSFNGDVSVLVSRITNIIIEPLIALLFAAGLVVFMWGLVEFLLGLHTGSEKKEEGKWHMLWGVIGMFIMVIATAIVRLIAATFGLPIPR